MGWNLTETERQARLQETKMALAALQGIVEILLTTIGEDPTREGLRETPERVAKAWLEELFSGYQVKDPISLVKLFKAETTGMVAICDIPVYSFCEHHLLPFFGVAHIVYIPDEWISGLSKFKRLIDVFARRAQVQERLTQQVADTLFEALKPRGLIVVIEAEHTCMTLRGVRAPGTKTTTSVVLGLFEDDTAARNEALSLIQNAKRK